MSDRRFLSALSCALKGEAARWFRIERERMRSWQVFAKMFNDRFVGDYDQQDLYDDLRRTQGKAEKVESFLLNFKYIAARFKKPPSEDEQVDLAYRNLLPEYRRAMSDKVVDTLDDIKRYGKRFEKQKAIDSRYVPPPPADKMHVPSAAYNVVQARTKVAAAEEEVPSVAAFKEPASKARNERKAKRREGKGSGGEKGVVEVEEVLAVQQGAPGTANQSGARGDTYSAVARGNAPPRDFAYPRRDVPVNANTPNVATPPTYNANRGAGMRQNEGRDERYENRAGKPDQAREGNWRRGHGNQRTQFIGPCFACQSVGHRASECPYVLCYWCRERGHVIRDYPQRANLVCNKCGMPGATEQTCARCAPRLPPSGNAQGAGQK